MEDDEGLEERMQRTSRRRLGRRRHVARAKSVEEDERRGEADVATCW